MLLMIDNYDSFTYNIVQYFGILGEQIEVYRNDKITIDEIEKMAPEVIIISPGPGTPDEAGISLEIIEKFKGKIPILGVCLGHQAIGQAFGSKVIRASRIMHGKISKVTHDGKTLFSGFNNPFNATRYHSLIIERETISPDLEITAWTDEGEIMGVRHKKYCVEGVQFHPESILTEDGINIFSNFLKTVRAN